MEALQLGAVQMLAPSMSKFGPLGLPQFEVFDLPYIFPNRDVLHRVTLGPVGRDLFKLLEPKGFIGLGFWDNGFKMMSANRPLHMPADYKGMKMRIKSSKVLEAQTRALGALPQVLAFSEVYQALQTGVVDGAENTLPNFYTQKYNEVQKFLALTSHGYDGYAVIVNRKFWEGLPPDIRKTLDDAMREATVFENDASDKYSRRRAREDPRDEPDRGLPADRRRSRRVEEGVVAGAERDGVAHRPEVDRCDPCRAGRGRRLAAVHELGPAYQSKGSHAPCFIVFAPSTAVAAPSSSTPRPRPSARRRPAAATATPDNAILLTVFLKHDQSKSLGEINAQLAKQGFYKAFPPAGMEVVSWNVVMGIGQIIVLRLPASRIREVNRVLEDSAWGPYRTEFFISYDYKAVGMAEHEKAIQ